MQRLPIVWRFFAVLATVIVLAIPRAFTISAPPALGPLLNLSQNPGASRFPFESVDGSGNTHVVWEDEVPPAYDDIYYRRVNSDGTLASIINLSDNSGPSRFTSASPNNPPLAVDQLGNAHIIWRDETTNVNGDVYYRRVHSDGSVDPIINLSASSDFNTGQMIAVDVFGNAHIFWNARDANAVFNVLYRKVSADGTISPVYNLSGHTSAFSTQEIVIRVDVTGNVYAAWSDTSVGIRDIFFQKILHDGTLANGPINVSDNLSLSATPTMKVDMNGTAYVVWIDNFSGNLETFFRRIYSDGSLGQTVNLSSNGGDTAFAIPSVELDGSSGTANVIWEDKSFGNDEIFLRKVNHDDTVGPLINVSQSSEGSTLSLRPYSGIDGQGNVSIVWSDIGNEDSEIMFRRVRTNGSLTALRNLSHNSGLSDQPFLLVDSVGNSHVVWRNGRSSDPSSDTDILYRAISQNGGLSPTINFTQELVFSSEHSTAVAGQSSLRVVWGGLDLAGEVDIYFRNTLIP